MEAFIILISWTWYEEVGFLDNAQFTYYRLTLHVYGQAFTTKWPWITGKKARMKSPVINICFILRAKSHIFLQ